ncbi:MAG TPA: hypothetical protein VMR76_01690 [Candidatus Saccharimonadia bacterium]|nr:hypothetical protein [Candidatus Saccharimonadia bacterium]
MSKIISILCVVFFLVFVALGVYYLITPAGSLPHHFPGYLANSSHKHLKHALACFIVAIGLAILAWFTSAKKSPGLSNET